MVRGKELWRNGYMEVTTVWIWKTWPGTHFRMSEQCEESIWSQIPWSINGTFIKSFPHGSAGKISACNVGDLGLIPGLERSQGEGNGYPFQYSGLDNSINRGIWQATVHGVAKSLTRLTEQLSLTKIEV